MGPNEHLLENLIHTYTGEIKDYTPFAPISNREEWGKIPQDLQQEIVAYGETFLDYEYEMIPTRYYMDYLRNGNRTRFQEVYFRRRRVVNALIMAECVEGKDRFLDDILNGIVAICEESGWQLPPHNRYGADLTRGLISNIERPVIDLFSAETAAQLAMTSYLMRDVLDEQSPLFANRIKYEINTRIVKPFINEHFFWMGEDGMVMNNWNPWCTKNSVTATLVAGEASQETKRQVVEKACKCLDYFITSYADDGACQEGASYYHAASLALFDTIAMLNAVTDNHFVSLYEIPKLKNMAAFIMNMHVADEYYVNYSDCKAKLSNLGTRVYLAAKHIQDEDMMLYAAKTHKLVKKSFDSDGLCLHTRVAEAWYENDMRAVDTTINRVPKDIYYESTGLFVTRDENIFVSMNGGDNGDLHGHNDSGSLILYKDGKALLIDPGVEAYTKKTFSPERYTIWTMQSGYHNVMNFGTTMQHAGRDYKTETVSLELGEAASSVTLELAGTYPEGTIGSYRREVTLEKGKQLRVVDTLDSIPVDTYLTFMTTEKPTWTDGVLLIQGESLSFTGCEFGQTETIELTDDKLIGEWNGYLYRTLLKVTETQVSMELKSKS